MSAVSEQSEENGVAVSGRTVGLLLAGFALVLVGIVVIVVATLVFGNGGSVGGVILIGPIPIFFGSGPNATSLIALSVILTIISIVMFIVLNRRTKRSS
ncbi:MAG: DUF131 domain-containing protein [Candidatus Bathyarchaeota archaeon]|nr:DUF131 domain-containing protein [Candidatus Bathyarchaeota archaeon]